MLTTLVAQREMCSDEWVMGILTTVGYVFFNHGGIRDFCSYSDARCYAISAFSFNKIIDTLLLSWSFDLFTSRG